MGYSELFPAGSAQPSPAYLHPLRCWHNCKLAPARHATTLPHSSSRIFPTTLTLVIRRFMLLPPPTPSTSPASSVQEVR